MVNSRDSDSEYSLAAILASSSSASASNNSVSSSLALPDSNSSSSVTSSSSPRDDLGTKLRRFLGDFKLKELREIEEKAVLVIGGERQVWESVIRVRDDAEERKC